MYVQPILNGMRGDDSLTTATHTVIFLTITSPACGQWADSLNPQSSWQEPGWETVNRLQSPFHSLGQLHEAQWSDSQTDFMTVFIRALQVDGLETVAEAFPPTEGLH